MRVNYFFRTFTVAVCFAVHISSASSQTNKPTGSNQAPTPSGVIVPTPAQYPSGIKINYVRTYEAMGPYTTEASFNNAAVGTDGYKHIKEATQYIDGLGRPVQTVFRQATPGNAPKDAITPVVYDEYGRQANTYLPYVANSNTGTFQINPFGDQKTYLQTQYPGEQIFYQRNVFESSPLDRLHKSFAPGNSWAGSAGGSQENGVQQKYLSNTVADSVRLWVIGNDPLTYSGNDATTNIPVSTRSYDTGALYKNVTLDESGNAVIEYKNKTGQLILTKVQIGDVASGYSGHSGFLCTYYIYDDFNQLRFVIQPKAVTQLLTTNWQLQPDAINELCFRYEYDERQRMIGKKVSGAGWVYFVFDKRDRMVFMQDSNMRTGNHWLTTLYDALNRPVMTGMVTYSGNRSTLQLYVDANTGAGQGAPITVTGTSYTATQNDITVSSLQTNQQYYKAANSITWNVGFDSDSSTDLIAEIYPVTTISTSENKQVVDNPLPPGNNFIGLSVTYYDDYNWTSKNFSTAYNGYLDAGSNLHPEAVVATASLQTRGMATGGKVRVLEDPSDLTKGIWLGNVTFYEDKGRVLQMQIESYKGGMDVLTNRYDFTGKIITNYQAHSNPAAAMSQTVKTNFEYDHAGRLLEIAKTLDNSGTKKVTSRSEYDELGQLKVKKLSQKPDSSFLETLEYTYNVRGWLQGINKAYANDATGSSVNWFGMELNYDYGFEHNQFTGDISGIKWKSTGDDEQRAYGFGYDKAHRFLYADFNQRFSSTWDKADPAGGSNPFTIDFSVRMGNGVNAYSAYDENGNILAMKQWGYKLSGAAVIDDLTYTYNYNGSVHTNKLLNVIDAANDANTKLGDFRTSALHTSSKNSSTVDYTYDANGNLKKDLNKDIGDASTEAIEYNHLNLPYKVTMKSGSGIKGTITYIYDASGKKLEKRIDPTSVGDPDNATTYIGGYLYENDKLQFLSHEEGRIRLLQVVQQPHSYGFDYFIKDHLGNVRMVLTDEQQTDAYPVASMENNTLDLENLYYSKLATTRTIRPPDYPADNYTNPNQYVSKLNGSGSKIGPGIVLKVMAGDRFHLRANSWYKTWGQSPGQPTNPLADLVAALAGGIAGTGNKFGAQELSGSGTLSPGALSFLNNQDAVDDESKPLAFVNWVLFDEQFRFVESGSGFEQVASNLEFKTHVKNNLPISKSGYLYVYCSNATPNIDVFFDNLQVTHIRGPLLEETHYYPFGLAMAGISSSTHSSTIARNRLRFNGYEHQNTAFADESSLEWYDYKRRFYDHQLGRFFSQDMLASDYPHYSPYQFAGNEVPNAIDIDGLESFRWQWKLGQKIKQGWDDYWNEKGPVYNGLDWFNRNINPVGMIVHGGYQTASGQDILTGENVSRLQGLATFSNGLFALFVGGYFKVGVPAPGTGGTASVWAFNQSVRGRIVESMLGGNLPVNFKTFDKFENGVATSIKSLDLTLTTYQKEKGIVNTLKGYINQIVNFETYTLKGVELKSADITEKVIEVAIQPGKATLQQWEQLAEVVKYANEQGVRFILQFIK